MKQPQRIRKKKPVTEKLFYKIGEVSRITGVEAYVLRYWETEFPFLKPRKSSSGQRVYVKKDIELIDQIKNLLYNERYTIEGVRKRLGEPHLEIVPLKRQEKAEHDDMSQLRQAITKVKFGLREILRQLS
ncbi:HTH-type transcriptional repressor YcgE [bacterium BMS3Abin07]|nr:HTH-type transcriptional repressor YcgE [bacterium BMS3Abin07]GBE32311.1 HTH-type transcriptional repressor YcgE [bacterium BMS3Bbin05]HDO23079.1 MerR family transcriptional regulator [Nitrospirota bacterium]